MGNPLDRQRQAALDKLEPHIEPFAKKVAPIYAMLDWRWSGTLPDQVPQEADIAATIRELIRLRRENSGDGASSTGGLQVVTHQEANYSDEDTNDWVAYIEFAVTAHSWDRPETP